MDKIIIGLVLTSSLFQGSTTTYVREEPVEIVKAEVSAYTSSVDETDDEPFITASGSVVRKGIVACPHRLEFGTKVEIKGKVYVCEDRMNRRYRDQENYDIWMTHKELAYEFGRQQLEVKIIKN